MVFNSSDDALEKVSSLICSNIEGDNIRALELAKEAVSQYPDNYRLRMFYAIVLGDIEQVSSDAEKEFIQAIRIAVDLDKEVFSGWPEEDVCYHLGIDAAQRGNGWKAAFFSYAQLLLQKEWVGMNYLDLKRHI